MLGALDDKNGKPVDWWFAYKLPNLKNPQDKVSTGIGQTQGTEYLYCDSSNASFPKGLPPQQKKILETGALFNTLQQLRNAAQKSDPNIGWILYDDEHTKVDKKSILADDGNFGHTKGVVAFDLGTNSAFWLLHSWPCFPSIEPVDPPALNFGQTFLCITLKDVATLDAIAKVFHAQTQPQIIGMSLPKSLDSKYPNLVRLSQDKPPAKVPTGAVEPSDTDFASKGGATFRLFAKSKDWLKPAAETIAEPKDLYSDLIGPALKVDLEVETWQDGEPDEDSDYTHTTHDVMLIDLRTSLGIDAAWHFTSHDHSKWAVAVDSDKNETDWVIVADINRVDSQFERGGCGIAFQNKDLARSLHSIINMTPSPAIHELIATDEEKAITNEKKRDAKRAATMGKKTPATKAPGKKATARKPAAKKKAAGKPAARKTTARKRAAKGGKSKRRAPSH